jgi:two-component system, NarL family, invasion response regulator UvrY
MIRVFLVDDHELVRTGFRLLLARETDIDPVGEAGSGEEALGAIRQLRPDVVISDLHLPGMSGLELTERLLRGGTGTPRVVIVSMQKDGPMPRRLLESGASAYLSKDCAGAELLIAVRTAARGKRYVGRDVAQQLALVAVDGDSSPFDTLSPREVEIVGRLVRGQRMADIAVALSLSPKTVATHKYRLLAKLGIADTVGLVRLAQQYGLLEPA